MRICIYNEVEGVLNCFKSIKKACEYIGISRQYMYELIKKECKGVVCVDKWTMYVNCEVHNNEQRGKGF